MFSPVSADPLAALPPRSHNPCETSHKTTQVKPSCVARVPRLSMLEGSNLICLRPVNEDWDKNENK